MFPVTAGAVGMLAGLLVVGTDLLSREVRGARLRFLERLPGGLSAAFLAKLAVFLLVVAGSALYGFGAACLADRINKLAVKIR